MTEKRKFTQHILPTSHHSKNKDIECDGTDHDLYSVKWGSSTPEPVDYEKYLSKNKGSILNDPHRELLIFPYDDLKSVRLSRPFRVPNAGVPTEALKPDAFSSNALSRHCISFFANNEWICTYQPSIVYRGHYCKLPRSNTIDAVMGSLVEHWFSTDQVNPEDSGTDSVTVGVSKSSPAHASTNPACSSASSRPWTTAVLAPRTRHSVTSDTTPNGSLPSSDTNLYKRTNSTKDRSKTSSDALLNGFSEGEDVAKECETPSGPKRETYLECSLAVCTRVEYNACLRVRENLLAIGQDKQTGPRSSTAPNGIVLEPYCFRRIQPDELLHTEPTGPDEGLYPGLYVISPLTWKANQPLTNNVIRLETVSFVHPIGDNWLKLDRTNPTKNQSSTTELFIYFDNSVGGPRMRQTWLDAIQPLTCNQVSRSVPFSGPVSFHIGSQESQVTRYSPLNGNAIQLDDGINQASVPAVQLGADSASVRNALQRFAQETEFFISHQRQKNRLRLITVFPEVRSVYHKTLLAAQDRTRMKSVLGSVSSGADRALHASAPVPTTRTLRGSTNTPDQTNAQPVSAPISTLLPFPDRTVHFCARRFLATCLRLRSRLQSTVETAAHSSVGLDNPEPFFVTMYLVNTDEGRRVSEEFYWNPNSGNVDNMIPSELFRTLAWFQMTSEADSLPSEANALRTGGPHKHARGPAPPPPTSNKTLGSMTGPVSPDRVRHCRSALFSVPSNMMNLEHIYLVVRVDKVLNGTVSGAADKYIKGVLSSGSPASTNNSNNAADKAACLLNRSMAVYCRHLGRYRMPFAWGARSLCSSAHRFPLFKMDPSRITEPAFMQQIQSLARLVDSSSPSQRGGLSISPEHIASIATEPSSRGSIPVDVVERTLKTQAVPLTLDLAISELMDQSTDSGVQQVTDLVTASLLPVRTGQLVGDKNYLIPPTHPSLTPNELVREVEHFFDIRSIQAAGVGTDSTVGSATGDSDLAILVGHSGGLHRQSTLITSGGSRSNRDSLISCSSSGSGQIGMDPAVWVANNPATSSMVSTQRSRTNSLERSNSRVSSNPAESGVSCRSAATNGIDLVPFTSFHNTLYVSPKSLNLAVKHNFSRARNLSCFIELRANDSLDSTAALKVFYTRPSPRQALLDTWCNTSVLYHEASPQFNEMFKLSIPLHVTSEHHLLFRFYHVSVDAAGSLTIRDKPLGKKPLESNTGYAWLPLLGPNGNLNTGSFQLSVASEIQPGYLKLRSAFNRGLGPALPTSNTVGDGNASWLEGGKPLFTVHLDSLSSIYTNVPVLARFFRACSELTGRILNLPVPQPSPGGLKTKTNRVTFRDDPIEGQCPTPDRRRLSASGSTFNDCGRHLCSAIKGLWVIEQSALVHFLPPLFNQLMELILISAAAGHRWSSIATVPDPSGDSSITPAWMDFGRSADTTNSPNEILRTTIGTMAVLISELNASSPTPHTTSAGHLFDLKDMGVGKLQSDAPRHELLRNYVKFAFDPDGLTARCAASHANTEPVKDQTANRHSTSLPIPLHHALVRGLILLLADTHCAQHILTHLFANLWFPFALIVKSMSQWLWSTQKMRADRAGEGRFPSTYSDDLALLIKLIGSYLNSAGSNQWLLNSLASTRGAPRSTVSVSSVNSTAALSAISQSSVTRLSVRSLPAKSAVDDASAPQRHTILSQETGTALRRNNTHHDTSLPRIPARRAAPSAQCEFHGLEVIASTARFLCHLFNLMDRGFVMQRVRDLLIFLEILPRMPVEEIDRLNELRFQLLNSLSQHEFFVQLNLPSLGLFQGGTDEAEELNPVNCIDRNPYELSLTEQFKQEHFLVGSILAAISCLLAGCVNTGSWATGHSASHLHRQPLVLLRNLLAKHTLDPRYATSKPCQARIAALYLPLIRLVLEHPSVIGSPGGALQAAVIAAAARGEFGESASVLGDVRRRKRGNAASGTLTASGAPASRPRSVVSDVSLETLAAGASHHSGPLSDSGTSLSLSNGSGGGGGVGFGMAGSSSLGGGSAHTSSSTHSAAYLTEDGKVEKHILEQIAGLNTGGPLRRAQLRRIRNGSASNVTPLRTSFTRSSCDSTGTGIQNASSSHSGSTVTLTGMGSGEEDGPTICLTHSPDNVSDDDDHEGSVLVSRAHDQQRDEELNSIRMVDDSRDGPDMTQDWASQVLTLAGVFSQSPQRRPPLPNLSIRDPPGLPSSSTGNHVNGNEQRTVLPSQSANDRVPETNPTPIQSDQPHQHRPAPGELNGPRRLTDKCQRELFVCVLHILSTVTEDHLNALLHSFTVQERIHFLCMLNYAIQHLRYRGKKCIQQYEHISRSGIGRTGLGGALFSGFHSGGRRSAVPFSRPTSIPVVAVHLTGEQQSGGSADQKDGAFQHSSNVNLEENEPISNVLLEANLATEAGLIVLDLLNSFTSVFKHQLECGRPSDPVFTGVLEVYVALLTNNPSECLLRHTFASLRVFVTRFAKVLFSESTEILNLICLTGLRCANQLLPSPSPNDSRTKPQSVASATNPSALPRSVRPSSTRAARTESAPPSATTNGTGQSIQNPATLIRMEACGLVYKLWKCSYENYGRTGFHRVHLQTIISVSKLVTEIGPGFEASLNLLHLLVETDMRRGKGDTGATTPDAKFWSNPEARVMFGDDVNDLIRRIRTVLTATNEMRQHNDDHERLVDLQYCLAKSYSSNPALRRTWLEELAKLHMASKSLAELAMAKLHTAALMAEYLKRRGEFPQGCEAFSAITSNICQEENGLRTDSALLEIPYTQEDLLLDINEAAVTLEAAGLYEAIRSVYALVIPIYEARQDYTALAQVYRHIGRAYEAIGHAEASGHRLFAAYFRVTFYGQQFESLANKSFIYRANACQKLGGMCNELLTLYRNKYGQDAVELLTDYAYNRETADPNKAYIQVTYVEPYKGPTRSGRPLTSYEKHHNVSQFMFETPFLLQPGMTATASLLVAGPKHSDDLTQQWKRRTVLTTVATFPHLRRRLEVAQVTETDMCPIDAAIDAIECKNQELMTHISAGPVTTPPVMDGSNTNADRSAQQHRISVAAIGLHSPITGADVWSSANSGQNARKAHRIPLLMDMQLQGALLPTVNVGPMAYAEAFLKAENQVLYPNEKVSRLRDLFFEFLTICLVLLTRYHHLMSNVHEAKYLAMRQSLDRYRVDLSNLLKEEIVIDEEKLVIGPKSVTTEDMAYVPAVMETSVNREHTL